MTKAISFSLFVLLAISTFTNAFDIPASALPKHEVKGRKSLGFGPLHSYSKFTSNEYKSVFSAKVLSKYELHSKALELAEELAGKQNGVGYFVRSDSYYDSTSGLTYVYIKQTVNGLQVENGDMNVVLSADGE